MNILITGGCGFIGSNLAVALKSDGHNVICFDNLSRRGSGVILQRILSNDCTFIHGDIRNREDFNRIKDDCEVMIECSAEPSVLADAQGEDAFFLIENNLFGAVNCFEYCRKRKMSVIFLSTSRVYPYNVLNGLKYEEKETRFAYNDEKVGISSKGIRVDFPLKGVRSLYGTTKLSGEYILQEYSNTYGMHSIINRFGVVAGPWQMGKVDQGVFTYWLMNHYFKRKLKYIGFGGKGKQVRDILHIDDLVQLLKIQILVIDKYTGQIFNAGGGTYSNLSLLETTELCQKMTGNTIDIISNPINRPADIRWYVSDNKETEKEFGWHAVHSPSEILTGIFKWLSENEQILKNILKG